MAAREQVVTAHMIERFVAEVTGRGVDGWSPELSDARWPRMVLDALTSQHLATFHIGALAAKALGIDGFDVVAPRAVAAPLDVDSWWALMRCATGENIDRVVGLAVSCCHWLSAPGRSRRRR